MLNSLIEKGPGLSKYFGHSANVNGKWQTLLEHSTGVAQRTRKALEGWSGQAEGEFAALAHDLGKYPDSFQDRLRGVGSGFDHWSAGAFIALQHRLLGAAFAIYGHHVGLPSRTRLSTGQKQLAEFGENHPQQLKLTTDDPRIIFERMEEDGLRLPVVSSPILGSRAPDRGQLEMMMDVRRLFSALTDADFLDTEEHMQGQARPIGTTLQASTFIDRLEAHLWLLNQSSTAPEVVREVRQQVLAVSREAALKPQGIYTLTAPTGAGKTLAMLAFALDHAQRHNLRRVITVLPFLTLIEQTVKVYRGVLKPRPEELIEHHSLSRTSYDDVDEETARRLRALTENWDAPFVVTTSVQFLESLFGDKPSMCRKLHRIANSVILLDEVQTIPVNLAKYTLGALTCLAQRWGCTIVMATATQPAFEHLSRKIEEFRLPAWRPSPIVGDLDTVFQKLRRTKFEFVPKQTPLSDEDLAGRLQGERQALVVVNLKRQARDLYEVLKAWDCPVFHLSTRNCAAHRTKILADVRARLDADQEVILVSTQCIEAGVDIDFPRAFRAYAPMDAIIQAAGRCNREGRRPVGLVTVFEPKDSGLPPGAYTQATTKTKSKLAEWLDKDATFDDPGRPALIREYFESLYAIGNLKKAELDAALASFDFPEARAAYRLIEGDTINILVPYDGAMDLFHSLKHEAEQFGISRSWMSRARPITVSEFRPKESAPLRYHLQPLEYRPTRRGKQIKVPDWFIYLESSHYHPELGLTPPEEMPEFII